MSIDKLNRVVPLWSDTRGASPGRDGGGVPGGGTAEASCRTLVEGAGVMGVLGMVKVGPAAALGPVDGTLVTAWGAAKFRYVRRDFQ